MNEQAKQYAEKAKAYFKDGANCAQAVLLAYAPLLNKDEQELYMLGSAFGGGMCGMREVCGAVSGALMTLGLLKGYTKNSGNKATLYALGKSFCDEFKNANGSIVCKDLLNGVQYSSSPSQRTDEYYKKRPCADLCYLSALLLAKYI